MKIAFATLGCKVNQFDTAIMSQNVMDENHEIVSYDDEADLYVINTCTVTENADIESRQWVRKAHRMNPNAKVVVTGCYAQTNPKEIQQIPGIHLILGNEEKKRLSSYLTVIHPDDDPLSEQMSCVGEIAKEKIFKQPLIETFLDKTRAFLKIQDGCNAWCSFCVIPKARGRSRSFHSEEIIAQLHQFEQKGYKEVVLTGINLGSYGLDLKPKTSLLSLFTQLSKETSKIRFRFSSIEPDFFTDDLIDAFSSSDRVCHHFHIPLQSGDPTILKKMNRKYSPERYRHIVDRLHKSMPDVSIGMDVMAGFPGESLSQFHSTYQLISDLPVSYLHVFPYSEREGTSAALFSDPVPAKDKTERTHLLQQLCQLKGTEFKKRFIGKDLTVLIEENKPKDSSMTARGLSDNYIKVIVENDGHLKRNQYVRVIPHTLQEDKLVASDLGKVL